MQHLTDLIQITHVSPVCLDACKLWAHLMIGAIMGVSKDTLLSDTYNVMDVTTYGPLRYNRINSDYVQHCSDNLFISSDSKTMLCQSKGRQSFLRALFPSVLQVQKGSYKKKRREIILSDNDIVHCIEAALWAFFSTHNFVDGCLLVINLGLNTSAIGAIYGQLAGLYYGLANIPQKWLAKLHQCQMLYGMSHDLLAINRGCEPSCSTCPEKDKKISM
jgi:ADP-ribosylglycohydrolase